MLDRCMVLLMFASLLAPLNSASACGECDMEHGTGTGIPELRYRLQTGSFARQLGLGGSVIEREAVLNPYVTRDFSWVFLNPALLADYGHTVVANIGGGDLTGLTTNNNGFGHQTAGLSIRINDTWNVGGLFGYNATMVDDFKGLTYNGGGQFPSIMQRTPQISPDVRNAYTGMVSYKQDSTLKLGLGLTYAWNHWDSAGKTTTPATDASGYTSSKAFQVRAGAGYTFWDKSSIDGYASYTTDKASDDRTVNGQSAGDYSVSGNELRIGARYIHPCSENLRFTGFGNFGRSSAEPKEEAPPNGVPAQTMTQKFTYSGYSFGVGAEYGDGPVLVAGGISYRYGKTKGEMTDAAGTRTISSTMTSFPVINFGGEYNAGRHLTFRVGHYRAATTTKTEDISPTGSTTTSHSTPNSTVNFGGLTPANNDGFWTLGLGLRWRGFNLDATVSEEALRRGLGTFGSNDNLNTFGQLSATFRF